jgi:hypothetical protein
MPKLQQAFKNLIRRYQDAMFTEEEAKKLVMQEVRKELNEEKLSEKIHGIVEEEFTKFT